jgi:hypothetical protein
VHWPVQGLHVYCSRRDNGQAADLDCHEQNPAARLSLQSAMTCLRLLDRRYEQVNMRPRACTPLGDQGRSPVLPPCTPQPSTSPGCCNNAANQLLHRHHIQPQLHAAHLHTLLWVIRARCRRSPRTHPAPAQALDAGVHITHNSLRAAAMEPMCSLSCMQFTCMHSSG